MRCRLWGVKGEPGAVRMSKEAELAPFFAKSNGKVMGAARSGDSSAHAGVSAESYAAQRREASHHLYACFDQLILLRRHGCPNQCTICVLARLYRTLGGRRIRNCPRLLKPGRQLQKGFGRSSPGMLLLRRQKANMYWHRLLSATGAIPTSYNRLA